MEELLGELSVLFVEDDEADIRLIGAMLERATHGLTTLTTTRDGDTALQAVRGARFDVCILDIHMQPMGGLELLPRLRAAGLNAPVLVLTGTDDLSHDLKAMRAGADAFLSKTGVSARILERAIRYARNAFLGRQEILALQAAIDPVTGLLTRPAATSRLEAAVNEARISGRNLCLAYLGINDFGRINAGYGLAFGDQVLRQVAERIQEVMAAEAVAGRTVGDEMLVYQPAISAADFRDRLNTLLSRFAQPVGVGADSVLIDLAIGCSEFPLDASDASGLVARGELAMRAAKTTPAQPIQDFRLDMLASLQRRERMAAELGQALRQQELFLAYEPFLDLETGAVVGAEALARWRRPSGEVVPPAEFIPIAEEYGMICALTDWALESGLDSLRGWQGQGLFATGQRLHINVPAIYLQLEDLVSRIEQVLARHGLPGRMLALELTESSLLSATAVERQRLEQLRELGVQLFIDDFGTGFSSLSYLSELPIDGIKVDRSFLMSVAENPKSRMVVRTIISLGQSLELAVVAEGIEVPAQQQMLLEQGCRIGQGYLFARPQPAEEFARMLGTLGG